MANRLQFQSQISLHYGSKVTIHRHQTYILYRYAHQTKSHDARVSTKLKFFVFSVCRCISTVSATCVTLPLLFSKSSWYCICKADINKKREGKVKIDQQITLYIIINIHQNHSKAVPRPYRQWNKSLENNNAGQPWKVMETQVSYSFLVTSQGIITLGGNYNYKNTSQGIVTFGGQL